MNFGPNHGQVLLRLSLNHSSKLNVTIHSSQDLDSEDVAFDEG